MKKNIIDLSSFKLIKKSLLNKKILFTVKSFNQIERQKRMIKKIKTQRIKKKISNVIEKGAFFLAKIKDTKILVIKKIKMQEPRHILYNKNIILVSEKNQISFFDNKIKKFKILKNKRFSFLHTLSQYNKKILITSSGNNLLFIADKAGKIIEEIKIPKKYSYPNCAEFINNDNLFCFFPINGKLISLNLKTKKIYNYRKKFPFFCHNFKFSQKKKSFSYTDTINGKLVILDKNMREQTIYNFNRLGFKPQFLKNYEWIQSSKIYKNIIFAIDSNRSAFLIFHLKKKTYNFINVDSNWCVQDFKIL